MNELEVLEKERLELIKAINNYSQKAKELVLSQIGHDKLKEIEERIKTLEDTWNTWVLSGKTKFDDEEGVK